MARCTSTHQRVLIRWRRQKSTTWSCLVGAHRRPIAGSTPTCPPMPASTSRQYKNSWESPSSGSVSASLAPPSSPSPDERLPRPLNSAGSTLQKNFVCLKMIFLFYSCALLFLILVLSVKKVVQPLLSFTRCCYKTVQLVTSFGGCDFVGVCTTSPGAMHYVSLSWAVREQPECWWGSG